MTQSRVEVLIIGAGPVGLAAALELGLRGRKVLVIEQNERGGLQPRAKSTNIRSMAHMRRWGIADRIRDASPLPADYPASVVFATRLFGFPIAQFDNVFFASRERSPDFPEPAQWIPQYTVEAVLRQRLSEIPSVTVQFNTRLESLVQYDDRVVASLIKGATNSAYTVEAEYMIGADGAHSTTRRLLGIKYEGDHAYMANFLAIYRAPGLLETHPQARALSYWLVNPQSAGVTGPMDKGDKWFFSTQLRKGVEPYNREEAKQKILQALGHEVPIEVLETDVWHAHKLIATSYRDKRVFLAGDACHLHPPMGGYGMNQGIGDAVDLGWKLDAVLQGWGNAELLASYENERKPVHRMYIEEATENYAFVTHHMVNDRLELDNQEGMQARSALGERISAGKPREFRPIGAILGYTYNPSEIIVSDGSEAPSHDPLRYEPSSRPGALLPHMWLADGTSIYDHLGQGYTLLQIGKEEAGDVETIRTSARNLRFPLTTLVVEETEAVERYGARLILVRPDQHVAWKGNAIPANPRALLLTLSGHGLDPEVCGNSTLTTSATSETVGIVGLGRMGTAIAHRLLDVGQSLIVWNRNPQKAAELLARGAQLAASPADLAARCSKILVIVRDDEAIRSVYFGPNGLLSAPLSGRYILEMTTATVSAVRCAMNAVAEIGGHFVDAPVSGSIKPAREGHLFALVGAEPDDLVAIRPLLDKLTRKVQHIGPPGSGIVMKLVLNLPLASYWRSLGEALALGTAYGLDERMMLAQIVDSKAAIGALASKLAMIQNEESAVEFDLTGLCKDMCAMNRSAADAGMSLPGLSTALEAATRAVESGWGEKDLAALVRFVARSPNGQEAEWL